ncbi:MAG: carboxypeptidase regulatory-like domain-containing protein, partial [Thalassolituus sp.]
DGYPEISREICSYTLTTQYTGGTGIGQGNLGGTITCDEVVATKPANHVIALGYDSDVILGAVYPVFYEGLTQSTLYGLPAYAENIVTGEKEWLTDAAIELRQREGLGQYYSDAAQMRTEFLGAYEASVARHTETPAGLMDNYPMPPTDKRAFNLSENISQEEFEAIIAAAEILAVEGNSLYSMAVEDPFKADVNAPVFSEETMGMFIADYSRNSFRFLSPTSFMSGAGLYSFSNDTTTTLMGSVTLPGNYVPTSGVTVTMLKADGTTVTTNAAADGTYAFSELTSGDYTLSIEYPNHVYECVTATVSAETGSELVLPQAELLAGDLNADGEIDSVDTWRIYFRSFYPGVNYDLNNDGAVNWADIAIVRDNQGASQCQL